MSQGLHTRITHGRTVKFPLAWVLVALALSINPSHGDAASCSIQINSEPPGANIYVNNKLQGVTPLEMKLPDQRATYQLRLRLRGYSEYTSDISCTTPPTDTVELASLLRIDVRIVFPRNLQYEGCGARVALNWRSGQFSLARMELFPGDVKSYSGYMGEYMTLTHSGYFFCPSDSKPHCIGKNQETEVIFDQHKSYEVSFKGQGNDCRTELVRQ